MPKPYASVIIRLLQTHALYDDDRQYWQLLQDHETAIRAHFEGLGVALDFNRTDGYARLTQPEPAEDDPAPPLRLPGEMRRDGTGDVPRGPAPLARLAFCASCGGLWDTTVPLTARLADPRQ